MFKQLIILLLFSSSVFAQTIQEKINFTQKAIQKNNPEKIIKYSNEVLEYYEKTKNDALYLIWLNDIFNAYVKLGNYEKCLEIKSKIVELNKIYKGETHIDYLKSLNEYGVINYQIGDYNKALEIFLECLNIQEKIIGKEHTDYINILSNIGQTYYVLQDFNKSLEFNEKCLELKKQIKGEEHIDYLIALNNYAISFSKIDDYNKALEIFLKCLKIQEKIIGKEHTEYINTLSNIGQTYSELQDYNNALEINLKCIELKEKVLGKNNIDYLNTLSNLAHNYYDLGDYKSALTKFLECLKIKEKVFGKKHDEYLYTLSSIGSTYNELGDFNKAIEINQKCLKLKEQVFSKKHPSYLITLYNLSTNYFYLGNYNTALSISLECLNIQEEVLGNSHPEYIKTLSSIGLIYSELGNYDKSLDIIKKCLKLTEEVLGNNHPIYLTTLNNLALNYFYLGDYNIALNTFLECLKTQEVVLGKNHPDYLLTMGNIGLTYSELGDYNNALEILKKCLKLKEEVLGKNHGSYLTTLNNLALNYSYLGDNKTALSIYLECLNIQEVVFGKKHPHYLLTMGNIGQTYSELGDYNNALEILKKCLKLQEEVLGKNHPYYLITLNNLAINYNYLGDIKTALSIYLECINIQEVLFGKKHPDYLLSLSNLSKIYYILKNYNQSDSIYTQLITQKTSTIHEKLIGLDYNLKEIIKNNAIDDYLRFTNYSLFRQKENPDLLNQSFNTWLNLNGLLSNQSEKLRTIVEQSGDKKLLEVYEDWIAQKMQLLKYYELTIDERNKRGIDIKKQQDNIAALEQQLSKKTDAFEEFKKQHSFADIQNKLKENEAYIDIVRLNYYDFNNDKWEDSVRYLVYVITKETKNKPMYIVLNNGKDLETDLITHYLSNNSLANKNNQEKDGVVYNNFWQPIADAIQNKKTIYTVLGGVYNNINLGTIYNPNTGKYLSEELDIRIINSGKSFVQNQNKSTLKNTKQTATLLGNPNFNANLKQKPTNYLYAISRDFTPYLSDEFKDTLSRSVATNALPGTKTEVENIGKLMRENKWETFVLLDTLATKTQLKNVNNPRVLHLATHGYFVNNTKLKKADGLQYLGMEKKVVADNPLLRSGLLLAGANKTLQGDSTPTNDNGIFTAYEASFLNLNQTELVVLSACETGKGDIKTGEGVYGLRKSFADAGAKNIIISLWAVDDDVTQQFMTNFYTLWLNGLTIKDAFTQTQNQIKQKYPLPYYWGGFILIENN